MSRQRDPLAEPERLIPRVYAYVAYIVGDGADAKEITHATIDRAVRHRRTYNPRRSSPAAWVFDIARYYIADRFREPLATTGDELKEVPESSATLDGVDPHAMRAAVARLGPLDRELIALRYGAEFNTREIGEQLGLRGTAVEAALNRARGRLRGVLSEQ